jgi:PPOX class probable F420-dependent enzyme
VIVERSQRCPIRVPTRTATPIESLAYGEERSAKWQPTPRSSPRGSESSSSSRSRARRRRYAPSFNTAAGRAKPRHLERDPRLSLIVVDPQDQYRWLAISGRADVTTDGADAQIDKLAKKYLDADSYPWRKPEEQRLTVRIHPEKIDSYGLD